MRGAQRVLINRFGDFAFRPRNRSLTVAASMRRPASVKGKAGGLRGLCPLAEYEAAPHARVARRPPHFGPRLHAAGCCPALPKAPFPSSQLTLQNGGNLSRARRCCAACEPLTDCLRSGKWIPRERGPGSQGACPLAEYEAAPHARVPRALPSRADLSSLRTLLGLPFCLLTPAPLSPCFHPHSIAAFAAVPVGVLNSRGAAISVST
jgi:hypothetical protein